MGKNGKVNKKKNNNMSSKIKSDGSESKTTSNNLINPNNTQAMDNSISGQYEVREYVVHTRCPVVTIQLNEYDGLKKDISDKED